MKSGQFRRVAVAIILFCSGVVMAQKKTDALIMLPIKNLFAAMEKGDSAMLHSTFFSDVTLITVLEKDGKFNLRKEGLPDFLNSVATPHADKWFEPLWDVHVQQDGNFAQVWASYAFYAGTKFSHCGTDTFQLLKTSSGWKIFYLADTRQRTGCQVPERISKKYTSSK
jgi:hypothetical protein